MSGLPETSYQDVKQSSHLSSSVDTSVHVRPAPTPYDGPDSLLRVIPLANYAPTARGLSLSLLTPSTLSPTGSSAESTVAEHIAPHTVSYPPSSSSSQTYPQYTTAFAAMNRPQSQQDWELRQQAERRISELLSTGSGYGR